jgi:hypothetical protein
MVFMIIFKWLTPYDPEDAPSIINTMINMVLGPTKVVRGVKYFLIVKPDHPLWGDGTN